MKHLDESLSRRNEIREGICLAYGYIVSCELEKRTLRSQIGWFLGLPVKRMNACFDLHNIDAASFLRIDPLALAPRSLVAILPVALLMAIESEDSTFAAQLTHDYLWPLTSTEAKDALLRLDVSRRRALWEAIVFAYEEISAMKEDPWWISHKPMLAKTLLGIESSDNPYS